MFLPELCSASQRSLWSRSNALEAQVKSSFVLLESYDSSFLFATITLSARRYLDVYLVILGNHYFSN